MRATVRALVLLVGFASAGCLGEVVLADPPRGASGDDASPSAPDARDDARDDAAPRDATARADGAPLDAGLDALDAEPIDLGAPLDGGLGYVIQGPGTTTATCTGALTPLGLDDTFTVRARVDLVPGYGTWWPNEDRNLPELTGSFALDNFGREPLVFSAADTITPDRLISEVDARARITLPDALEASVTALIVERPSITPQSLPLRLRYFVESAPNAPFGRCRVDVELVTRAFP